MNGDHIGETHQLVQRNALHAEIRSFMLADIGIVQQHLEVERLNSSITRRPMLEAPTIPTVRRSSRWGDR